MKHIFKQIRRLTAAFAVGIPVSFAHAQTPPEGLALRAANVSPDLKRTEYLDAVRVGNRIVAVGEHGTIALTQDGKTWKQARVVPVQSTLSSVVFVGESQGWAVGHWGVVLHTDDGGETWTRQRADTHVDQPLFSVHFINEKDGIAVGLWSLLLRTSDGGRTWETTKLSPDKKSGGDRNLFHIFSGKDGAVYVSAEKGTVYRSTDGGLTWATCSTGYSGSLWAGTALRDGTILVGGLRGSIFRSTDGGQNWSPATTDASSSITELSQLPDGTVVATALDGITLQSDDGGKTFKSTRHPSRANYTGAVTTDAGALLLFSARGIDVPDSRN